MRISCYIEWMDPLRDREWTYSSEHLPQAGDWIALGDDTERVLRVVERQWVYPVMPVAEPTEMRLWLTEKSFVGQA